MTRPGADAAAAETSEAGFGREYLERRILEEFPLGPHLGIGVEIADDREVLLRAPLAPNANDKGTAFGGSLYSVAVLAGWAWITRYLASRGRPCEVMIQESAVRFLMPCTGEIRARAEAPAPAAIDRMLRMLDRAERGRISLCISIGPESAPAVSFDGVFAVAALSPKEDL